MIDYKALPVVKLDGEWVQPWHGGYRATPWHFRFMDVNKTFCGVNIKKDWSVRKSLHPEFDNKICKHCERQLDQMVWRLVRKPMGLRMRQR